MKSFFLYRILPAALPLLLLAGMRFLAIPENHENCTDVYWHIYAADRSFPEMTAKEFPITLSVWKDHFADKEFLFHVLLKVYTTGKHLFHSPVEPPFSGAALLLLLLFFSAFVFAARKAGIPDEAILLCALGTALFSPLFTYRLLMIRPHVLSMTLMLISYGILLNGPEKWKTVAAMFGMGWLFAWSYSTPHLLVVATVFFAVSYAVKDGFRAFYPVISSAAGIFCGLLIHPQSPNTFLLWKLQGIDALFTPAAGLGGGLIPFAKELSPPSTLWLTVLIPLLVLLYFTVMMWNRLREQFGWRGIPPGKTALCFLSAGWFGAVCMISIRPIEYAVPTLFLAAGTLLPEVISQRSFRPCRKPYLLWGLFSGYILLGVLCTGIYTGKVLAMQTTPAPTELVSALKQSVPSGARVINLDWSDFPPLIFLAPEYEYTWGLDPMFSFTLFPEKSKILGRLTRPGIHSSGKIRQAFQAEYGVVLNKRRFLGRNLQENCGWETIYDGPDGWIFRLSDR